MLKKIFITIFVLSALASGLVLYSRYIGTKGLVVREYKITDSNLTEEFHGFKIVQISDLHYGTTFKSKELKKLVEKVNILKPDVVVLTGDLLDKNHKLSDKQTKTLIEELNKIDVTIDKYVISGNHDIDNWDDIIKKSGFVNLNDDYTSIYNNGSDYIFLAGLSSNLKDNKAKAKVKKIENYLGTLNKENQPLYKILLIHEPDYIDDFNYSKFNLILAGHSHNGQIRLPFLGAVYNVKGSRKYYDYHYKLKDTDLYISGGLGTSGYDFRFLNHPSINFYRLTNK